MSATQSSVSELVPFLTHERADVREAAVDAFYQLVGAAADDEASQTALEECVKVHGAHLGLCRVVADSLKRGIDRVAVAPVTLRQCLIGLINVSSSRQLGSYVAADTLKKNPQWLATLVDMILRADLASLDKAHDGRSVQCLAAMLIVNFTSGADGELGCRRLMQMGEVTQQLGSALSLEGLNVCKLAARFISVTDQQLRTLQQEHNTTVHEDKTKDNDEKNDVKTKKEGKGNVPETKKEEKSPTGTLAAAASAAEQHTTERLQTVVQLSTTNAQVGAGDEEALSAAVAASEDALDWVGQILRNVTQLAEARAVFLKPARKLMPKLLPLLAHPSPLRRQVVASIVRNCCFEFGPTSLAYLMGPECKVVSALLQLLRDERELDADDMDEACADQVLWNAHTTPREPCIAVMKECVDALVLLCGARKGRQELRVQCGYAILRDLHADLSRMEEDTSLTPSVRGSVVALKEQVSRIVEDYLLPDEPTAQVAAAQESEVAEAFKNRKVTAVADANVVVAQESRTREAETKPTAASDNANDDSDEDDDNWTMPEIEDIE